MRLWLASGNKHKKVELEGILRGHILQSPQDAGIPGFNPVENGDTFLANAFLKARALRSLLALRGFEGVVLADDSGLCVDALGGRPGIYSSRYVGLEPPEGKNLSSQERNIRLLGELGDASDRRARFICTMLLLWDENCFGVVQETLEGEIVRDISQAAGTGGFGYDPIFYLPALGCTVAELPEEEKNRWSHRGKAGRKIARLLAEPKE